MSTSFVTQTRFFDNKHYPRGFSRHSDFTIKEAQLLEKCGTAFQELACGKRGPINDEEKQFIAVCQGTCQPTTNAEKVWIKYLTRIKAPKRFHTLLGGKPQLDITENYIDGD